MIKYTPGLNLNLKSIIKKWMLNNKHDYDNATSLAEAAAHHGDPDEDHDDWLDDSDHWIWELAIEIIPPD